VRLVWTARAWAQYRHWQDSDPAVLQRINQLIEDAMRHPFTGLGKPEPLKRELAGWWSRRITSEHRLIYRCVGTGDAQQLEVLQCRFHY
jgi:toxin YoeB